jgi:hypothetical protein
MKEHKMDERQEHEKWFQEIARKSAYVDFDAAVQHVRRKAPSRYPRSLTSLSSGQVYALRRFLSSVGDRQGKDKGTLDVRRYVTILWDDNVARALGICKMVEEMFGANAYVTPYVVYNYTGTKTPYIRDRVLKVVVMFREEEVKKQLETVQVDGNRLSNGYSAFRQMLLAGV